MADRPGKRPVRWTPENDREAVRRRKNLKSRTKQERVDYDPGPPSDDDWVIGQDSGLKRIRRPEPVGDALGAFLARTGWADRVRTTRLLEDWQNIVGPEIAANAEPMRIERGVLHLAVTSTTWATQLTWLEATIVEKINAAAGSNLVNKLRVTVRN